MSGTTERVLRYLPEADLETCLPEVERRLELAATALVALARGDAEMPPKIGVHPRPGALLHAMPAWLRTADLVGLKWVAAFPENRRLGLPAIDGLVVLNDAATGVPTWVMGAGRITAVRTAAVSGVAMRLFAPLGAARVAIVGAGVQARSHLEVVAAILPEARVTVFDRHPERAADLARAQNERAGREWIEPATDMAAAVRPADIVITVATLGSAPERLTAESVRPGALVVAVDFATLVAPALAHGARRFVVDDRAQFDHYRSVGYFDGYPDPTMTLGDAAMELGWPALTIVAGGDEVAADADRRPTLVTHLGVGLADVIFASAISDAAAAAGAGTQLPR